ncbi:MAG: hypothetical protein P1V35_15750, partial [Planctomycetota bacterium]|nr:hypothetical protein [Planctomycetota bacterium]
ISLEPVAEAGILAGVVGSQSGTYTGQLLIFLRDDSGRLVGVFPSTWKTGPGGRSVAPFTFEAAPLGPLELDVVSLGSEVAFRVEPAHLVAPNEHVQVLLRDAEPACDWTFEVFDSESGEALEALDVRYEVRGGAARRFLGERKQDGDDQAVWTWTRIAGEMRWNRFEGPAPWVRLATDAQFTWSVRSQGYAPHVGDQAGFAVLEDGSRHIRVGLKPMPLESEKTE